MLLLLSSKKLELDRRKCVGHLSAGNKPTLLDWRQIDWSVTDWTMVKLVSCRMFPASSWQTHWTSSLHGLSLELSFYYLSNKRCTRQHVGIVRPLMSWLSQFICEFNGQPPVKEDIIGYLRIFIPIYCLFCFILLHLTITYLLMNKLHHVSQSVLIPMRMDQSMAMNRGMTENNRYVDTHECNLCRLDRSVVGAATGRLAMVITFTVCIQHTHMSYTHTRDRLNTPTASHLGYSVYIDFSFT